MILINSYKVYLHVFPNGKKYVGCTSDALRNRWSGGLGYISQKKVFAAILKFGWENIRHYLLFDDLDEKTAKLIEAALIRDWKTTMRGKGYNEVQPRFESLDIFVVPEFKRVKIIDTWEDDVNKRYRMRLSKNGLSVHSKPVRLVETGEIFASATEAARATFSTVGSLARAARTPGATCGTCTIFIEERGIHMDVRAHWEYVTQNTEEKDDKK